MVTTFEGRKQNKHCVMLQIIIFLVETTMTSIMVYNMDYRKNVTLMLIYQPHICGPRMTQNLHQTKHGLMWVYFYLMVGQQDTLLLFDTVASKAVLNKKFYYEYPMLHQSPKYPINVQPMQVANDQHITVKEVVKFLISFGSHTFEIIAYLLPSCEFIFGLKTMTEIKGKSNYSKLEFKFKKRSYDITLIKTIHLPVGKTTAFDSEMIKKLSDLADGPVFVKLKSLRESFFT